MASFVIDWSEPETCTNAVRLSKKITVFDGVKPLMDTSLDRVFNKVKPGMSVLLMEKGEKWSGTIESKWGKFTFLECI